MITVMDVLVALIGLAIFLLVCEAIAKTSRFLQKALFYIMKNDIPNIMARFV